MLHLQTIFFLLLQILTQADDGCSRKETKLQEKKEKFVLCQRLPEHGISSCEYGDALGWVLSGVLKGWGEDDEEERDKRSKSGSMVFLRGETAL